MSHGGAPPKISSSPWGYGPPPSTCFLGPTRLHVINVISAASVVFVGFKTNAQTDHACSNRRRCNRLWNPWDASPPTLEIRRYLVRSLQLLQLAVIFSLGNVGSRPGAGFTKYLTTILWLSYDNAKVTINLRRTSNLQNILRRAQGFSQVRFTWKVVRSSETVFAN